MKVGVISLGCVKNRVDTENMLASLVESGYSVCNKMEEADILIVNTCGFINPAKEESIDTIFEMAQYKEKGKCKVLCVTGCLSQRYGKELRQEIPEIDLIIGVSQYDILPNLITSCLHGEKVFDISRRKQVSCEKRVLTTKPYSAYVKTGEGCNNRCTFCAIPLIRGAYHSRPEREILDEIESMAKNGVREHILVAQDTSRYGTDIGGTSLTQLMRKAAEIQGVDSLRVLYCYPDSTSRELIDMMSETDNICKYIDLPLQHASPLMLKKMNRRGDIEKIRELLLYAKGKGFALRTTFIVGFPGETEEDFQMLLRFTKELRFDRMGAFAFSPEEDTAAFSMADQLPEHVKQERLNRLMALQQEISLANNQGRIGSREKALITGRKGSYYLARTQFEAPDADGVVYVESEQALKEGEFYDIEIIDADAYDLFAKRC